MNRDSTGDTLIYQGFIASKLHYFVRFCPLETERFPHGIAFKQHCSKEQVKEFQKDIEEYIDQALPALLKTYGARHGLVALQALVEGTVTLC